VVLVRIPLTSWHYARAVSIFPIFMSFFRFCLSNFSPGGNPLSIVWVSASGVLEVYILLISAAPCAEVGPRNWVRYANRSKRGGNINEWRKSLRPIYRFMVIMKDSS